MFIIGHLTIEKIKRVAICFFKFLPVQSMKHTALFNLRSHLSIDRFITIIAYLSHFVRLYPIQKRFLFFFSINVSHTQTMHVHKCVMNTREKSSFFKDQTQYSTVNLVHIWIEPFGYISINVAHVYASQ